MLYKNIFLLLVAILVFSFQSENEPYVAMKDVAKFRNGIEKMAQSTNSIKASFKQEKYLNVLANMIESEGNIHFKKPNLLNWQYTTPFEYGIILNGKKIAVIDQGSVNSFDIGSSQAFKQINELIIKSVQGNVLDEERFDIKYFDGKEFYLTKLNPKEEQLKKFLKGVDIYFDKNDYSVSKIKLIEPEDDYTLISFYNKKMNEHISDEKFTIK